MKDGLIDKIEKCFEDIDYSIEYFLKNKYENPTGELLFGEEVSLPRYAVIYSGMKDLMLDDEKFKRKCSFEKENKTEIQILYIKNCNPVEGFLDQLKSKGYEIIFQKN